MLNFYQITFKVSHQRWEQTLIRRFHPLELKMKKKFPKIFIILFIFLYEKSILIFHENFACFISKIIFIRYFTKSFHKTENSKCFYILSDFWKCLEVFTFSFTIMHKNQWITAHRKQKWFIKSNKSSNIISWCCCQGNPGLHLSSCKSGSKRVV